MFPYNLLILPLTGGYFFYSQFITALPTQVRNSSEVTGTLQHLPATIYFWQQSTAHKAQN